MRHVAQIITDTYAKGHSVIAVVSAQGDTTDDLIAKAAEITHNPSAREMDMLLAAGEEISISLLAMALNELGCHATSLTGWQAGFRTDRAYTKARITLSLIHICSAAPLVGEVASSKAMMTERFNRQRRLRGLFSPF